MGVRKEVTEVTEAADSVTLKRSVKGVYSWEIKLYFEGRETSFQIRRLGEIDGMLRTTYLPKPAAEGE